MQPAPIPENEEQRLASLRNLGLLDTPPEERFDRITRTATRIFHVPILTLTLVDAKREWFKSCQGLSQHEGDRAISFCGHALVSADVLVVPDTTKDARFADNPMVTGAPHIRFYAGVPVMSADGARVGVFCIKDVKPREFSKDDEEMLKGLAAWAEAEMNSHNFGLALNREQKIQREFNAQTRKLEQSNRLLDEERNKLETTLRGIGEGIFVIDRWEVVTFFNAAAEGISGYSASEIVGKPYQKILRFMREEDGEIDLRFIDDALFKERVVRIHVSAPLLLLRKSGKPIAVAANAAPLRDERGETTGVVVIFRDVSHEREIDRAKTEFISLATHQLRTPLTTMKWIPEMFLDGALGKLLPRQRRYIEDLRRSAERLIALINQLLDIAHIESRRLDFKIEDVVVADVFRDLRLDFAHEAKLRKQHLIFRAPEPAKLRTDRRLLGEILRNLISNAVKYTPNGGRIVIALQPFIKGFVRLSVKDDGIGIPEEQQKHLFEKFFRADNAAKIDVSGTGLGLYIIKGIAGALGGTITFESREGKGTTFFVDMPIEGPPPQT